MTANYETSSSLDSSKVSSNNFQKLRKTVQKTRSEINEKLIFALSDEHANLSVLTENGRVNFRAWFEFLDYLLLGLLGEYGKNIKILLPAYEPHPESDINPIANLLQDILREYTKRRHKHPNIQQNGELRDVSRFPRRSDNLIPVTIYGQTICFVQCHRSFQRTVNGITEQLKKEAKNLYTAQQSYDEKIRLMRQNQRLKSKNEVLREEAYTDALTGMFNRKRITEFGNRLMEKRRHPVIAFLDIDHFKKVNDQYGHAAGDISLKLLANKMEEAFHTDEFAERINFGRMGGEEFLVLFDGFRENEAYRKLDEFRNLIAQCSGDGIQPKITISIGMESTRGKNYTPDKDGFSKALSAADTALYAAKEGGRDRVVVYKEGMQKNTVAIKAAHLRKFAYDTISYLRMKFFSNRK